MSINTELARIKGAKANLQSWVEENGVTVPDGTLIDGLVELAKTVEAGGGGSFDGYVMECGSFTPVEAITDVYEIETNFSYVKKDNYLETFFVCYRDPYHVLSDTRGITVIGAVGLKKNVLSRAIFGGYVGGAGTNNNNLNYHSIGISYNKFTITCSSTASLSANKYNWIAIAPKDVIQQ